MMSDKMSELNWERTAWFAIGFAVSNIIWGIMQIW